MTAERRLLVAVGATLFIDTIFYSALNPLLPALVRHLGLSTFEAGVLTASYAAGALIGTAPAALIVTRRGPRAGVSAGLSLIVVATVAFAVLDSAPLLDLARLAEGIGGSCAWTGGLAWIVEGASADRRGTRMGQALAMSTAGSLSGPLVGALASTVGRGPAFGLVAAIAAGLIGLIRRVPDRGPPAPRTSGRMRGRWVLGPVWLVALPAMIAGALSVLGALRLHHLGGGPLAIAATFLIAAVIEAFVGPWIGRLSDRHGRDRPLSAGMVVTALLLCAFALPTAVVLMSATIVAIAVACELFWTPAMALVSERVEERGLPAALSGSLINIAWAGGTMAGAAGGGALAQAAGDAVPMVVAAALAALTLATRGVRVRGAGRARRT